MGKLYQGKLLYNYLKDFDINKYIKTMKRNYYLNEGTGEIIMEVPRPPLYFNQKGNPIKKPSDDCNLIILSKEQLVAHDISNLKNKKIII